MKYNYKIHNLPHVFKSVLGALLSFDFLQPKNQLIVLNFHGTQKKFLSNFISQINFLKQHYDIISPSELEDLIANKKKHTGNKMVITFDDGIKNNLHALSYLHSQNISAYLFIVPEFINTHSNKQTNYFTKNIRPIVNKDIDTVEEDFLALSWDELNLLSSYHTIGCHTLTHTMLKDSLSSDDLKKELIESKQIIESNLKINIQSFCSINNTLSTVGKQEALLIKQNYNYHFTTFGGINKNYNPLIIERINVESHWLLGAVKFALTRFEFNRWKQKIDTYVNNI